MNKKRVLDIIKKVLNLKNRDESEEFTEYLDLVMEEIAKELEVVDEEKEVSAKLGNYIKITKKHVKEKSGKVNGLDYTVPAYDSVNIKRTKKLKELNK